MSFALGAETSSPDGPSTDGVSGAPEIWVLDQVNLRVQVVSGGQVVRRIPLVNDTYQDLAVDSRGRLALVDRLALRHVAWLEGPGQPWRFTDVEGPGLPEGGGVTALFLEPDGVWLQWAHQHLVRVTDAQGKPDARRPLRWGRPSAQGRVLLRAAREGMHEAVVLARDPRSMRAPTVELARVGFAKPLVFIKGLVPEPSGGLVLVAHLVEQGDGPRFPVLSEELWAVRLGTLGQEQRRIPLAVSSAPLDQFQSLRVGRDGSLYHLTFDDQGATLWRVKP